MTDKHHGWLILAYGVVLQAITLGTTVMCSTFWVYLWVDAFDVSITTVMSVFLASGIATAVVGVFAGRLIDLVPLRGVITGGTVALSVGLLLLSLCQSMTQVIIVYATFVTAGFVLAGSLSAQAAAIRWFPERRGLALGIVALGPGIGGLIAPQVVARLLDSYDWRDINMAFAVFVPIVLIPLTLLIVRMPADWKQPTASTESAGMDGATLTTRSILTSRTYWAIAIACTALFMLYTGFGQSVRPFTTDLGFTAAHTATILSVLNSVRLVGSFSIGALSDRFDQRLLFAFLAAAISIGIWSMSLTESYAGLVALSAIVGFAAGGLIPIMAAIVATQYGQAMFGRVIGLLSPCASVAALGSVLIGAFRESTGTFASAFRILILILTPFMLAILFIGARRAKIANERTAP